MKNLEFFQSENYRKLLEHWLENQPGGGHGERSKLARAIPCHTAYVTHVLKGRAQFSPEQALRASQYMGLSDEETRYFLGLVALDRAGSEDLRNLIRKDLNGIRHRRKDLKTRLKGEQPLELENQLVYYSKWYHSAIHFCLTVPTLRSPSAIARALRLSIKQVQKALIFLVETGLAEKKPDGSYQAKFDRMHLDGKSPLIQKHHTNWRMQAIAAVDRSRLEDLHYSSVISIHPSDEVKVREILVQAIEKVREVVKASPDPLGGVFSYCLDFFPVSDVSE